MNTKPLHTSGLKMSKKLGFSLIVVILVCPFSAPAQVTPVGQQRFIQPIIINGQQSQGVLVVENGTVQTTRCSYPQSYVTVDQSSSGWACFEQATGMWLLHALRSEGTRLNSSHLG